MYNTRRGGGTPSSNVGQRRPVQNQNFVPGGTMLRPTRHPLIQQRPANNTGTPQGQQQKVLPKPTLQNKPNIVRPPAPVITQPIKKEEPEAKPQIVPAPIKTNPSLFTTPDSAKLDSSMDSSESVESDVKPKPVWIKKGKISKAERNKKRNERLKKILQPKNALMVLNEIVGQTNYELVDVPASERFIGSTGPAVFKATVLVDEKVHEGYGKSKPLAKNAAAEAALKHLVLTKFKAPGINESSMETDEVETKETEEKDEISYSHLASYALFKLFNSWEDALPLLNRNHSNSTSSLNASVSSLNEEKPMLRPSKKLPQSPEKMNPVMLLNQMHPEAVYEEICQTGNPPNVVFTMKCIIGDSSFVGSGSSKKTARREAAFQACREVLGIKYDE